MSSARKFRHLTVECIEYLKEYNDAYIGFLYDPPIDQRWDRWHCAAYDEPGFLCVEEDYFGILKECKNKDINTLDILMVRGCITALLRKMRYGSVKKDTLIRLLERWLELVGQKERAVDEKGETDTE